MRTTDKIFVAGHRGLVGSALVRRLQADGFQNILTASRDELDLRNQAAVNDYFQRERPDIVFLAAGTVGGIMANSTRPAEFIDRKSTRLNSSHRGKSRMPSSA